MAGETEQPARSPRDRRWMTDEDDWEALQALVTWFAEHPRCADPAEGIKALGLPDMTGVPADKRARTSTHRRMAAEATSMLQHAGYAIRKREAAAGRPHEPSRAAPPQAAGSAPSPTPCDNDVVITPQMPADLERAREAAGRGMGELAVDDRARRLEGRR